MKKFVSILTVVAMVAALSTSAFAALNDSEGNPYKPGAIVPYDPGYFNGDDNSNPSDTQPGGGDTQPGSGDTQPGSGDTQPGGGQQQPGGDNDNQTPPPADNQGGNNGGGNGGGNAGGGNTNTPEKQDPTAKLDDFEDKDGSAYKLTDMLLNDSTVTAEGLVKALGVADKVNFPFTIASNPLTLENAVGVEITELPDGRIRVRVGQNKVTEGKAADKLFVVVCPDKAGETPEVVSISLDNGGNMVFETSVKKGAFFIGLKTE